MKERNTWLAAYQNNDALALYIKKARTQEKTEKDRAHFDNVRTALREWQRAYAEATGGVESLMCEKEGAVSMSNKALTQCTEVQQVPFDQAKTQVLRCLMPWRKGPFNIFNTIINAEWRSDLKWQRLADFFDLELLCKNKIVLDVGANNLYYAFRMVAVGARFVLAIEPAVKYAFYHEFFSTALPHLPLYFEMIGAPLESCFNAMFETVFCMGILYHQRNPLLCLQSLHRALKKDGLLVVETLCLNRNEDICVFPQSTYQRSRGYWFIPSASVVRHWLTRCNFEVLAYDEPVRTTHTEQGSSDWLTTYTLENFLDPGNTDKTVEGYDAPFRCMVVARKKG